MARVLGDHPNGEPVLGDLATAERVSHTLPNRVLAGSTLAGQTHLGEGATGSANWRNQANCHGRIELFFAKRAERPEARARREAKALTLCNQCTVAAECRDFARSHHEYGFWAGESEEDRHVLGFTVSAPIGTRARRPDPIRRRHTAS